ncbi:MAG TPA: hypothetical protein VFS25_16315 [Chitinophaga sp.]|uniref:hypothetical protein n=1 Tax=Chitinophaga sp. TaxID=1869181 RepID=UPI002DB9602D|nr:hypothetical protein [Chitinophaga sp.]HEU4554413.1 hypothetical protein [Chitinophaga sp.]
MKFQTPAAEDAVIVLLEEAGLVYLEGRSRRQTKDNYGDLYFEQRTGEGLTEANVLIPPGHKTVDEFSLRFSILSPQTVIDQTFAFLQRLNNLSGIKVYDTEIRNHIMRQLRKSGKVDQHFKGLSAEEDDAINKLCFLSLNADDFKRNELEIMKRQWILNNTTGEIIEGGNATIDYLEKKGLFNRFWKWIKKEL